MTKKTINHAQITASFLFAIFAIAHADELESSKEPYIDPLTTTEKMAGGALIGGALIVGWTVIILTMSAFLRFAVNFLGNRPLRLPPNLLDNRANSQTLEAANNLKILNWIDSISSTNFDKNQNEEKLRAIKFKGKIPSHFLDPINHSIMKTPIILLTNDKEQNGQSFDISTVKTIMMTESKPKHPVTKKIITKCVRNRSLEGAIENWINEQVAKSSIQPIRSLEDTKRHLLQQHSLLKQRVVAKEIKETSLSDRYTRPLW